MDPDRRVSFLSSPRIDKSPSGIFQLAAATLPCRVLIVGDDAPLIKHLSGLLEAGGYEPLSASTGKEALRMLDATPFQMVVTDWQMADMDGIALCREVRLRKNESYVYLLILTVRYSTSDVVAGLAAGADDYVIKGATPAEILARLEVGRRTTYLERSLRKSDALNRRMAVTDGLTDIPDRRFLMKYLPREIDRARRYNQPLSVISCDLDNFRRINDEFGYEAGDEVLQEVARRAGDSIRRGIDWVVRYGGGEFVIVLPDTRLDGAHRSADRLREVVSSRPIDTSSGPLAVTVSVGVTALETAQELSEVSARELLRAADRYLCTSKRLGKNRATAAAVGKASIHPGDHGETGRATR